MVRTLKDYIGSIVTIHLIEDEKKALHHIDDILEVEFTEVCDNDNDVCGIAHIKSDDDYYNGEEHCGFTLIEGPDGDVFYITTYESSMDDGDGELIPTKTYIHIDNTDLRSYYVSRKT